MKTPSRITLSAAFCTLSLLGACAESGERGSGVEGDRSVRLSSVAYDTIEVSDALHAIVLEAADGDPPSVRVLGDDNLLDRVRVSEQGGQLQVDSRGNYRATMPLRVLIYAEATERYVARDAVQFRLARDFGNGEIAVRDASSATIDGVLSGEISLDARDASQISAPNIDAAPRVSLTARDASNVSAVGTCDAVNVSAADASNVDASALNCFSATVTSRDASDVRVCAADYEGSASDASRARDVCATR